MSFNKEILLFLVTISCLHLHVFSYDHQVGGIKGWTVPPFNETTMYNEWASNNRFQVGDSILFDYKKDSVMEVGFGDYMDCNSNHPKFFSNTGSTVYKLDTPGPFYFISGVSGHCEKGQKMIIKVMSEDEIIRSAHVGKSSANSSNDAIISYVVAKLVLVQFILSSFVAFLYH